MLVTGKAIVPEELEAQNSKASGHCRPVPTYHHLHCAVLRVELVIGGIPGWSCCHHNRDGFGCHEITDFDSEGL